MAEAEGASIMIDGTGERVLVPLPFSADLRDAPLRRSEAGELAALLRERAKSDMQQRPLGRLARLG